MFKLLYLLINCRHSNFCNDTKNTSQREHTNQHEGCLEETLVYRYKHVKRIPSQVKN